MKPTSRSILTAMLCAAAVTGQFVAGKATRDALFLTSLELSRAADDAYRSVGVLDPARCGARAVGRQNIPRQR